MISEAPECICLLFTLFSSCLSAPCAEVFRRGCSSRAWVNSWRLKMRLQGHDVTWAGSVRSQPLPLAWLPLFATSCSTGISRGMHILRDIHPLLAEGRRQLLHISLPPEQLCNGIFLPPSPLEEEGSCRCLPSPGGSAQDLPCEAQPGFVASQDRVG